MAQTAGLTTALKTGYPGFIIPNNFVIGCGPGGDNPEKDQRNTHSGYLNYLFAIDFGRLICVTFQ
ncbi:MAG: hypothetical protein ABI472_14500 [Ginsengibacter sp.]